ncbi:glycine zipper family protein [Flavobacterium sp.]|uniref:glycine zipper family protein n=1 Tax=Flavobacterium sp. TaxID=239 RepID=UPI0025CC30F8|nr:glycine zipper family protein [Flavobacterium sp.]
MKNLVIILAAVSILVACKNTDKQGVVIDESHKTTIDSMKRVAEKQHIIDSMKVVEQKVVKQKEVVVVHDQQAAQPGETTHKRRKWSGAAKGAVIGAGVGAITGAAISKNKAEGAIIGGLAGAGLGAGTGAIIDDKKKK